MPRRTSWTGLKRTRRPSLGVRHDWRGQLEDSVHVALGCSLMPIFADQQTFQSKMMRSVSAACLPRHAVCRLPRNGLKGRNCIGALRGRQSLVNQSEVHCPRPAAMVLPCTGSTTSTVVTSSLPTRTPVMRCLASQPTARRNALHVGRRPSGRWHVHDAVPCRRVQRRKMQRSRASSSAEDSSEPNASATAECDPDLLPALYAVQITLACPFATPPPSNPT